jgi:hypothetical protein
LEVSVSLLASVSLPTSPFPPLAVGFFGLGTGYLIYGPQELVGYPPHDESIDYASGIWGLWMPGFMQFLTGIYLFALISVLGVIVFFKSADSPVGGLFIGLVCVYVSEFFASLSPDRESIGRLGQRALGFFHIAVGFWLMYLTFAVVLNFVLKYTLPV